MDFSGGSDNKESSCNAGDTGSIPGSGRLPGEGNGNSSILAWRIPWTGESSKLQFMGLQRVGHDWVTNTLLCCEAPILWPPDAKNWLIGRDSERLKAGRKGDNRGWNGWMASPAGDGHEFEQALAVGDGQGSLMCCSPWGCKVSDTTERLNWTENRKSFRGNRSAHLTWVLFLVRSNQQQTETDTGIVVDRALDSSGGFTVKLRRDFHQVQWFFFFLIYENIMPQFILTLTFHPAKSYYSKSPTYKWVLFRRVYS